MSSPSLDVDLLVGSSLAHDGNFHKKAVIAETGSHSILSGGLQHGQYDLGTLRVCVGESVNCFVDMLAMDDSHHFAQFDGAVVLVHFPCSASLILLCSIPGRVVANRGSLLLDSGQVMLQQIFLIPASVHVHREGHLLDLHFFSLYNTTRFGFKNQIRQDDNLLWLAKLEENLNMEVWLKHGAFRLC